MKVIGADLNVVQQFKNFPSWGELPANYDSHHHPDQLFVIHRSVPPAWFAYAMGVTSYCPPAGEL
jgi:hypothetical protein